MSSRDPDELRAELKSIDFSGDPELLPEFRDEARETVDNQIATLNDIDTKASRILRLNIVLIGVLVSAVSIAAKNGSGDQGGIAAVDPFLNVYMQVGVGALVASTAFAAMTYTTSELDVGLSSNNLKALLDSDFSRSDLEELMVKNYEYTCMSEEDHEDARENRERAVASLLDGGERVAKGRQRDGDGSS